jgi:hypothetical protein
MRDKIRTQQPSIRGLFECGAGSATAMMIAIIRHGNRQALSAQALRSVFNKNRILSVFIPDHGTSSFGFWRLS